VSFIGYKGYKWWNKSIYPSEADILDELVARRSLLDSEGYISSEDYRLHLNDGNIPQNVLDEEIARLKKKRLAEKATYSSPSSSSSSCSSSSSPFSLHSAFSTSDKETLLHGFIEHVIFESWMEVGGGYNPSASELMRQNIEQQCGGRWWLTDMALAYYEKISNRHRKLTPEEYQKILKKFKP
jgi:hypothetical protein